jgi:two-component system sensor histidine kinase HydH
MSTLSMPIAAAGEELKELIRSFNATASRVQDTHQALHQQVSRLQEELAAANEQLRRSRSLAALGEMAAGIAHEVRNPLGSIQLYATMLAEDLADRPQEKQLCERITRAVSGLDAVVRDVLAFARQTTIHPRAVGVAEIFDRALEGCAGLLEQGGIEVQRGPGGDLGLHADPGLLQQAVGNLVRNAVEAMTEAGAGPRRLWLGAERRAVRRPDGGNERRVVLVVRDTGPGVPPEALDRMFNPFFTTRPTGTGLGLAIVHRIVDAHGGSVAVSNRLEGGAQLELALPAPAPAAARQRPHRNSARHGTGALDSIQEGDQ